MSFVADAVNCPGTNPAILLCTIPTTDLVTSFGYQYGEMLQARIRASNTVGDGGYSTFNTVGDTIKGAPTYMNAPVKDSASSTATVTALYWTALTLSS
jgi:hypothetical protein